MPGVLLRHWPVGLTLVRMAGYGSCALKTLTLREMYPEPEKPSLKRWHAFGMTSDEPILWQHDRLKAYADALAKLTAEGFIYGHACSRKEIQLADEALGLPIGVYPGTCRHGTQERPVRALRVRVPAGNVRFHDRRLGDYLQNVEKTVGDFVLKRADGFWAYQLCRRR